MSPATQKARQWRITPRANLSEAAFWLRKGLLSFVNQLHPSTNRASFVAVFDIDGTILTRKMVSPSNNFEYGSINVKDSVKDSVNNFLGDDTDAETRYESDTDSTDTDTDTDTESYTRASVGRKKAMQNAEERMSQTFVFQDILALAQLCTDLGLTVAIITARSNSNFNRWYTHQQLEKCGIKYNYLYMREPGSDTRYMKLESRQHLLATTGGVIVMLLGDNWPDISFHDPPSRCLNCSADTFFVGYSPEAVAFLKLPAER